MSDRGLASAGRTSVSEQVAGALREGILAGSIAPGSSLREVALAQRFAVSRPTVREAIRLLVAEGLVQHHMHRGAVVAEPTPEDVVDVYRARAAVEVAAAGAAPTATAGELAELAEILTAMEAAFGRGDWEGTGEADLAFHRRLVALAGSPRLTSFYEHLQGELRLVLLVSERDRPDPRKVAEHRRMLDLAAAGDVEGLRAAVSTHVAGAQELLVHVLRARRSE